MAMLRLPLLLTCLLLLSAVGDAARILAIFQSVGRSQWGLAETYLRALERRGHHVTVITTFPSSQTTGNWTEILIRNPFSESRGLNAFKALPSSFAGMMELFVSSGELMCDSLLSDGAVRALYRSDQTFDLVVAEIFFTECLLLLAHRLATPVLTLSTFAGTDWIGHMVGNPSPYAHVPNPFLEHTARMGFLQRLENALTGAAACALRRFYYLPRLDARARTLLEDGALEPLAQLERRVALVLVNYHPSHGSPRPLVPGMVEVGGLHVRPPQPLPQDIQKFLDDATDGAIFFSMGSNIRGCDWPPDKLEAMLRVFRRLPQRVLWKWEAGALPGQPHNVMVGKWLPQSDILAHANVRAFISHGGLLSAQEAAARGVPLLGIPVFMDQRLNVAHAVQQGVAVRLDARNVSEASLRWALDQLLHDARYRDNARRLSQVFNDRPQHPLEEAVFWTEYVIRHHGAPHLRSAALDLAWYQYLLLDVAAVALATVLLLLAAVVLVTRGVARCLQKAAAPCGATRPPTAKAE